MLYKTWMKWSKNPWFLFAILLVATAGLLVWLNGAFPGTLSSQDNQIHLARSLLILSLVGGSLALHRQAGLNQLLKNLTLWTCIFGVVFLGYSFRHEAKWLGQRMLAEIMPSLGQSASGSIRFPKSSNGHFLVKTIIDSIPVTFLVDTGATDIVLSPDDATRLGYDTGALDYSKIYNTANGRVFGAPVELGTLTLGPVHLTRIRASVNGAAMNRSLLGMSFLNQLSRYEVTGDHLILYP